MPNCKINQGSITDGEYKLEIRMPIVCDMSEFPEGSHIKVIGLIKWSTCPHVWVLNKADISKESDQTMSKVKFIKGGKVLKRPADCLKD